MNSITDQYLFTIEGFCSVEHSYENNPKLVAVTCKKGPKQFVKDYLRVSDNVTYFVQQLDNADVSTKRYKVVFKPSVIVPDIELK